MKNIIKLVSFIFLIVLSLTVAGPVFAQTNSTLQNPEIQPADKEVLDKLYKNSYEVFRDLRNDLGVYRDSVLLEAGANYHPSSVAASGIGLMSLAIADKKGWETDALEKAKKTLATMNGQTAGFHADRTTNGYYRHFINMETGAQEWNSEYSTIDTAIFVTGALFAAKYFNDPALTTAATQLYNSIDFEAAIANIDTGGIYLTMNADGTGGANSITLPYNEYIIVAWLAYNQNLNNPESKAVKLWQEHFATTSNLLTKDFNGISLLTDNADHYLPSFTLLFPYYMVNMFSQSSEYNAYVENAYKADKRWSELTNKTSPYEWGNGAGASLEGYGYHADAINNNQSLTISPHIISGFLPANPSGYQDLIALYKNNKGIYNLQSDPSKEILWRYSVEDPAWKANSIQGIDYSTFLFGLATLDTDFGLAFFQENNQFFTNVTFDLNGGTSTVPLAQNVIAGETLQEPQPAPTRPNHTFTGWNTKADGSGTTWDFATSVTADSTLTLYAQWTANTQKVTFHLNGGTGTAPSTQTIAVGAQVTQPSPDPVRANYTFIGWNTNADGSGTTWDFAKTLVPDNDINLYAQWKINTHTIVFDLNGGTSAVPPKQTITVGALVQKPASDPVRANYTFVGWNTSADGSGTSWDFTKTSVPDHDVTLYAQWKQIVPSSTDPEKPVDNSSKPHYLPKTGENSNNLPLLGVLLVSCLAVVLYYKKQKI